MSDKSDYKLPRTKMHKLLPSPLDSEVNRSVFENLFNRFLTKTDTERAVGYIGKGNQSAIKSRQLQEPTISRQANQLQPVLYSKIGTVEHITTWTDVLNELERLGVDIDNLPQWGSAQVFNWVPPVDIDKLVNYFDYYWIDDSQPDYITIKNRCTVLDAQVDQFTRIIENNKPTFNIIGIASAPAGSPQPYDKLLVAGDYTTLFEPGFEFFIKDSPNVELNNTTVFVIQSTYNSTDDRTTIQINIMFTTPTMGGVASLEERLQYLELLRDDQCSNPIGPLGKQSTIVAANQWIDTNRWTHRTMVNNFATAKQAAAPIIEFDSDLELNEWSYTTHSWKYRSSPAGTFTNVTIKPSLVELRPLSYDVIGAQLVLTEDSGDQTSTFVPGSVFETTDGQIVEVNSSVYERTSANTPYKTTINVNSPITGPSDIIPLLTANGDPWFGYHKHWLFVGTNKSTAINHQTKNPFIYTPASGQLTTPTYTYTHSPYSQTYTITTPLNVLPLTPSTLAGWSTPLTQRAYIENNDIRVYVNGIRWYDGFVEQTELDLTLGGNDDFVAGISFNSPLNVGDIVVVEVGPAALSDIGYGNIVVRTDVSDVNFNVDPQSTLSAVSLINHRIVEQVKTSINQYPLFDVYNTDQTTALIANHLFGFKTSQTSNVNLNIGKRVVVDGTNFTFEQQLLNGNQMLAYRTYDTVNVEYWVDTTTDKVMFWNGYGWSVDGVQGNRYGPAVSSQTPPTDDLFQGMLWFDTFNQTLNQYNAGLFTPIVNVVYQANDPQLLTIWRAGLNNEEYTPRKIDWKGRTLVEYNDERDTFISTYSDQSEGLEQWYKTQYNPLSPTGVWIGDWEIPDPLYYNNQHENRACVNLTDIVAHFNSIKAAQPLIPGYGTSPATWFHSLSAENVNYGLGGTIHEYNSAFDTLLSSVFVNNVTPPTLFEFARDQYEILLNSLQENLRGEIFEQMLKVDDVSITKFQQNINELILGQFVQNDANNLVYGDSLTFIDNDGIDDIGIQNWISTLPFLHLIEPVVPEYIKDEINNINQIIHHDGHRSEYQFAISTINGLIQNILATPDNRTPNAKMGIQASTSPPLTVADFSTATGSTIDNRHGMFWYSVTPQSRKLYRLSVASAGTVQPDVNLDDGTLWLDLTVGMEVLRIKNGINWDIVKDTNGVDLVPGEGKLYNNTTLQPESESTISAWQLFDLNQVLANVILDVERKLYDAAPKTTPLAFDFATLQSTPSNVAQYVELEEQAFLNYVRQFEIVAPYVVAEYSATDAFTWNYYNSAPGQTFDIVSANSTTNTITIAGEHVPSFSILPLSVKVKNTGNNDGMWTVVSATQVGNQTILTIVEPLLDSLTGILYNGILPAPTKNTGAESAGDWRSLYQQLYNTPYPHLEPWKLQEYTDKPTWWDDEYKNTNPQRRWTSTMWINLQSGIIPIGNLLPDGITVSNGGSVATTYNYFSVDTTTDILLPPYFATSNISSVNRSVFTNISEIRSPAADSAFGQHGKTETDWRLSTQHLYDKLVIAFQMEPLKTISSVFGFEYNIVGELLIDKRTNQTPAHNRTVFHGDVINDSIFKVAGINQWYINYNRYQGFDSSLSNFRQMWTGWTAPLTYQFGSYVDTTSFQLGHRNVPISEYDYNIISKRSPGVEDFWLNALRVTVLVVPPRMLTANQSQWVLDVNINSPLSTALEYYDVHNYKFLADPTSSVCKLYTYNITGVDFLNESIYVSGDQTDVFSFGTLIEISQSTGNDGQYTIRSAVYDPTMQITILSLTTPPISPIANGVVTADYRKLPWQTGDKVFVTSTGVVPIPLISEQPTIGPIVYFIIRISDTEFMFANTQQNALFNIPIQLTSAGTGTTFVGELHSTFYALDREHAPQLWRHYAIDKTIVRKLLPPTTIRGMQPLVDLVSGYSEYLIDQGFRFNDNSNISDPDTGRHVNWQVELERFIDFAYSLQNRQNSSIGNRYEVTVDAMTSVWSWGQYSPSFPTGTIVNVMSTTNSLPAPLLLGIRYYIIADTDQTFRLAHNLSDADSGIGINMVSVPTNTTLMIHLAASPRTAFPSQEINPFRNSAFFRPPRGVVSNLMTGPNEDIRTTQLLFDQYGRPINPSFVRVYRQDKSTHIQVNAGVRNDVEPGVIFEDPYNFLHLGGAHIFIDAYEHVLMFNNKTTEGVFIYDPFIGLNVTKFELLFDRQSQFTQRPNVGGSFYQTYNNQGGSLCDNFEASVENIRYMYDVANSNEGKPLTIAARATLGYDGNSPYLADLNLTQKSQFMFWRGMIQNKGSVNSIDALINSRRFIDAKVDEFWAYKIASFGSAFDREYPELYVNPNDVRFNDFRIEFTESVGDIIPGFGNGGFSDNGVGYDVISSSTESVVQNGITTISVTDQDRWYNQPDIASMLNNNGNALYLNLKVNDRLILTNLTNRTIRHNFACDFETITVETIQPGTLYNETATAGQLIITLPYQYITSADHIQVFKNGSGQTNTIDYVEVSVNSSSYSSQIRFNNPLTEGDVIKVIFNIASLVPDKHTSRGSSNVIHITNIDLIQPTYKFTVWGYRTDFDAHNPAVLIDRSNNTTLTTIQLWDPARGFDYQAVLPIINIRQDVDPAIYSETLNVNQLSDGVNLVNWNAREVGTVWYDTSMVGYVPYYDENLFQNVEDQLRVWGKQADWSRIKLYEWVESDVPPEEYNDLAVSEEGNMEIPEHLRKSGLARETIFEFVDDEWEIVRPRRQTFLAAFDGVPTTNAARSYDFVLDSNMLNLSTTITNVVSVYVNGVARQSVDGYGFEVDATFIFTVDELNDTDEVVFVKYPPSGQTILQGIDDGQYAIRYEHTKVQYIDNIGNTQIRYYFWVENKATKNLQQIVSPKSAEQQLTTIPVPYMVPLNPVSSTQQFHDFRLLERRWQYQINNNDLVSQTLGYQVGNQTHDDYVVFSGGNNNPLTGYSVGDVITLTNGMIVDVLDTNIVGDVVKFYVRIPTINQIITPITGGIIFQSSVSGANVGSVGFYVNVSTENFSNTKHFVSFGAPLNVHLRPGMTEADFDGVNGNGTFIGGLNDTNPLTTYNIGSIITLTNGITLTVNAVDLNGDVTGFVINSVGDSFSYGSSLTEQFSNPSQTNSGFELQPSTHNVQISSIMINNRELSPGVEYIIDITGRYITINQIAGLRINDTLSVEYNSYVPQSAVRVPERQTAIVIRGLQRYINEDRRYTVRFTRDFTLRDDINNGSTPLELKQGHEQWMLMRAEQPQKIDKQLWIRLTECMTGYKLDNPTAEVPTLNRVLYDARYGTDTRFGLGSQQAFSDGVSAIATVISELDRPDVIFENNIDISVFFENNTFTTPAGVETAMDVIYNTFGPKDVNRIFFAALHDAFSFKREHAEIFKTSMIAVHGIRPFTTPGLFDD